MENSPFIARHDSVGTTRSPKRFQPLSTRPWILSLFLAATGVCFGLLMAVSLVEKVPTSLQKRNLGDVNEHHARLRRQETVSASVTSSDDILSITSECIVSTTVTISICSASSGYSCLETTAPSAEAPPEPTGSCVTETRYLTYVDQGIYLSLTSQEVTQTSSASAYLSLVSEDVSSTTDSAYLSLVTPIESTTESVYLSLASEETSPAADSDLTTTRQLTYGSLYLSLESSTVASTTAESADLSLDTTTESVYIAIESSTVAPTTTESVYISLAPEDASVAAVSDLTTTRELTYGSLYLSLESSTDLPTTTESVYISIASDDASPTADSNREAVSVPTDGTMSVSVGTSTLQVVSGSIYLVLEPGSTNAEETVVKATISSDHQSQISPIASTTDAAYLSVEATPATDSRVVTLSSAPSDYLSLISDSSTPQPTPVDSNPDSSVYSYLSVVYLVVATDDASFLSQNTQDPLDSTGGRATATAFSTISGLDSTALAPFANPLSSQPVSTSIAVTYVIIVSDGHTETQLYTADAASQTPGSPSRTMPPSSSPNGVTGDLSTITDGSSLGSSASTLLGTRTSAGATSSTYRAYQDPVLDQNLVLIKLDNFPTYYYFLALYLPKIVAVVMATLWSIIFAGLKLMEPLYQLSSDTGAFAGDSMFGNYLANELGPLSLSATFHGRWVLLLGGTVLIGWAAVVALMSEVMVIVSTGDCRHADGTTYRCAPGWAVSRPILYALLGLVGLIFALVLVLVFIVRRRERTGVYTDPSSIAAMAELLGNPLVMEDLRAVKPASSDKEVKMLLGDNRYKIGLYDSSSGKEAFFSSSGHGRLRWGLIKMDQGQTSLALTHNRQAGYGAVRNPSIFSIEEKRANRQRRVFQTIFDTGMLLTAMCIFGLVLGYYLDNKSDPLNDFFNLATFGPRFVLTSLALILSIGWRRTFQEMTVMAPYRAMAKAYQKRSSVNSSRSILAPAIRTPWTALYKGLVLRRWMVSVTAVCVVLADFLLIAVSGVPFSSGQTVLSLKISTYFSLGVSSIMILTSIAVLFHRRTSAGGTRKLPRSPDTLMGVWLYLCQSTLVTEKEGLVEREESPLDARALRLKYEGFQCGFARVIDRDGIQRWTVDTVTALRSAGVGDVSRPYQGDGDRDGPYSGHNSTFQQQQQQYPQAYEASATPIESPNRHRSFHNPSSQAPNAQGPLPVLRIYRPALSQLTDSGFGKEVVYEAQSRTTNVRSSNDSRYEEFRSKRGVGEAGEREQPAILNLNSQARPPEAPRQRQPQVDLGTYEALAQWEYEQEYHNEAPNTTTRRRSGSSSLYSDHSRWTNDGRSQFKYG